MVDGNELYIVDWDEIMMAPLERDSFFYINDKEKLRCFKKSIEERGINYNFNNDYNKYYVYKRFFEDLSGYVDVIAESDSRAKNEKMYSDMEDTCFVWLYGLLEFL